MSEKIRAKIRVVKDLRVIKDPNNSLLYHITTSSSVFLIVSESRVITTRLCSFPLNFITGIGSCILYVYLSTVLGTV